MQTISQTADNNHGWHGIEAIRQAAARHGWLGIVSRIVKALVFRGPAHLLQIYRAQRAAIASVRWGQTAAPAGQMPAQAGGPGLPIPKTPAYELDRHHAIPIDLFHDFIDCWDKHAAILELLVSTRVADGFCYWIVVSRHPDNGFSKLSDTLTLAQNLTQRAKVDVRVIVYDPYDPQSGGALEGCEPPAKNHFGPQRLERAGSTCDLRKVLAAAGPQCLVQFMVCGDQITPVFAEILARSKIPRFDLILVDMYIVDARGSVLPIFLPGINPIHAANVDYFLSRSIIRAGLAAELLGNASALDVYALTVAGLRRCLARGSKLVARHIAFPLLCINETREAILERRTDCLVRRSPLTLEVPSPAACSPKPRASIVICTRNNGFLIEQLVERLRDGDVEHLADIIVVSNQTTNPYALHVLDGFAGTGAIKLIEHDQPFNFSAQSNLGAAAGDGEILLFLNDDIVPVTRDWLTELIAPLQQPDIGVVGPLLLYPDQSVQHAGMFLGFNNIAGHTLRGARLPEEDYGYLACAPRQVMAVTGAALCMRRRDFETLNGFDQNLFALHIQDVDLCLRAHFSGLAVVYNPRSILIHMESVSVRPTLTAPQSGERRGREHAAFLKRWGAVLASDPFHNVNLARDTESLCRIVRPMA
jgi:GT2 family glycosyltransferase